MDRGEKPHAENSSTPASGCNPRPQLPVTLLSLLLGLLHRDRLTGPPRTLAASPGLSASTAARCWPRFAPGRPGPPAEGPHPRELQKVLYVSSPREPPARSQTRGKLPCRCRRTLSSCQLISRLPSLLSLRTGLALPRGFCSCPGPVLCFCRAWCYVHRAPAAAAGPHGTAVRAPQSSSAQSSLPERACLAAQSRGALGLAFGAPPAFPPQHLAQPRPARRLTRTPGVGGLPEADGCEGVFWAPRALPPKGWGLDSFPDHQHPPWCCHGDGGRVIWEGLSRRPSEGEGRVLLQRTVLLFPAPAQLPTQLPALTPRLSGPLPPSRLFLGPPPCAASGGFRLRPHHLGLVPTPIPGAHTTARSPTGPGSGPGSAAWEQRGFHDS